MVRRLLNGSCKVESLRIGEYLGRSNAKQPGGQGSGLIENHVTNLAEQGKGIRVANYHALFGSLRRGNGKAHWNGNAKGTRAGHNQNGNPRSGRTKEEGQRRNHDHRWNKPGRDLICDLRDVALCARSLTNQIGNLRNARLRTNRIGANPNRGRKVYGPGRNLRVPGNLLRNRFSGNQRVVQCANSIDDDAINWNAFASRNQDDIAHLESGSGNLLRGVIRKAQGEFGNRVHKSANRIGSRATGANLEPAAEQHNRRNRNRNIREVGLDQGSSNTERDECVHGESAMAKV